MDENARIKETQLGSGAQRILDDEAFLHAIGLIKDRIWKQFPSVPVEALPSLQLELKLLDEIIRHLRYAVETGKLSQVQLNQMHDRQRKRL